MRKRFFTNRVIATLMVLMMILTVFFCDVDSQAAGGWRHDSNGWYYMVGGSYYVNQWALIDGSWYFFNSSGYMESSCYRDGYWLGSNGAWVPGYSGGTWKVNGNGWWFEDNGWTPTNQWLWINGSCYYFNNAGYMESDCYRDGCWIGSNGAWDSNYYKGTWKYNSIGWWYEDNGWYPCSQGLWIDGDYYWFNSSGYWVPSESSNSESQKTSWKDELSTNDNSNESDTSDNKEETTVVHSYEVLGTYDGIDIIRTYSDDGTMYYDTNEYSYEGYKGVEYRLYTSEKINLQYLYFKFNGDEGYRDLGHTRFPQYIPNYNTPEVWGDFYPGETTDEIMGEFRFYNVHWSDKKLTYSKDRWKNIKNEGYSQYVTLRLYTILKGNQSFDIYYKDNYLFTVDISEQYDDFEPDYEKYDDLIENDSLILSEISKYKDNMTDAEQISAINYWIYNHSYDDYTCFSAYIISRIMSRKGYVTWGLACSNYDENGNIVNDYNNFYALSPKNYGFYTSGHQMAMIRITPEYYCIIQTQGDPGLKKGETDFSVPWTGEGYTLNLVSVYDKVDYLQGYDTVYDMIMGDWGVDITNYDPFDCSTWY